jgi:hypothetical protein
VKAVPFHISYHYKLIDGPALIFGQGEGSPLPAERFTGGASAEWLRTLPNTQRPVTLDPVEPLKRYARNLPWAEAAAQRVILQEKAHPRVTSVLKLFEPRF